MDRHQTYKRFSSKILIKSYLYNFLGIIYTILNPAFFLSFKCLTIISDLAAGAVTSTRREDSITGVMVGARECELTDENGNLKFAIDQYLSVHVKYILLSDL